MKNTIYIALGISGFFCLYFWYMVAYAMYDDMNVKQKKFVSDGCTFLFDNEWSTCCLEHDRAYWLGGNADDRFNADTRFEQCLFNKTRNDLFSTVAYGIVRIGGVPYFAVPWRWGYGWPFGRGYRSN